MTDSETAADIQQSATLEDTAAGFGLSVVLGPITGVMILVILMFNNGHGGFSLTGYYMLGPALWLARLPLPEGTTVPALMAAQSVVWFVYWRHFLLASGHLSRAKRVGEIVAVHFASVAVYHGVFGLS